MKINENKIRHLIRKKILEQVSVEVDDIDRDGIPDGIDRDISNKSKEKAIKSVIEEEDPEATKVAKDEFLNQSKLFENGCVPGIGLSKGMTKQKARELADKLYEATEGSGSSMVSGLIGMIGIDAGIGTDEAAVQAVFSDTEIQSLVDLSYVAHMYEKRYPGYDISSTLAGEYGYFSSKEFRRNVRDPLEDLLDSVPIFILGDEKYDSEKIAQLKKDSEKFISDSQELIGRDTVERVTDAAKGPAAAAGVLGVVGAAGNVAGAISTTGLMGGGLLSAMGSGFVGGATAGSLGTAGAAVGTAAVTGTAAGTGAFLPVIGSTLALIPGPGWVILGTLALGSSLFFFFDEAEFTMQEESMLSPDLYRKLNKQFKDISKTLVDESRLISIPFPPEEVAIDEEELSITPLPADINGISNSKKECIRRFQAVMNAYSDSRDLAFPSIKIDGVEGPETRGMWSKFVVSVFKTHTTFSTLSIASVVTSGQVSKWQDISSSMVSTYPGYTKTSCGCLAFCLDAYYNNVYYGKKQPEQMSSGGAGGSGSGSGGKKSGGQADTQKLPDKETTPRDIDMSMGGKSLKDIKIGVDFNNENIENNVPDPLNAERLKGATLLKDVFPSFNTRLSQRLLDNMKEYDIFSGRDGRTVDVDTVYELQIDIKRNGMAKVKKAKEAKRFGNRSGRNFGKLSKLVAQVLNDEFNESARIVFDKLRMQIRLPAGKYPLSENSNVRRLVRNAIMKQLLG